LPLIFIFRNFIQDNSQGIKIAIRSTKLKQTYCIKMGHKSIAFSPKIVVPVSSHKSYCTKYQSSNATISKTFFPLKTVIKTLLGAQVIKSSRS
jgi:hypothetical protein